MKQICIIMATYNGEQYLAPQIESILNNTFQNIRLHIFDDGSTDGTAAIAGRYAQRHPEKIYFRTNQENKGVIRNFLDAAATLEGDYYMFCDQDDIWLPDKIQKTLSFMEEQEAALPDGTPVVVFTDAKVADASLTVTAPSFQRQSGYHTQALDFAHLLMENKLNGCNTMFNRAAQEKLTPQEFPSAIRMHDWWLALIGSAFGRVAYLDEALMLYRQHEKNVVGGKSRGSYLKQRISHLKKDREALYATMAQGEAFLSLYGQKLTPEKRKILRLFTDLPKKNWFARRFYILRHGFLKSGLARNIGIMLVI